MARLVARTPCEGLLPVTAGSVTLSEVVPEATAAPLRMADTPHRQVVAVMFPPPPMRAMMAAAP